jgi:hypothetical protein
LNQILPHTATRETSIELNTGDGLLLIILDSLAIYQKAGETCVEMENLNDDGWFNTGRCHFFGVYFSQNTRYVRFLGKIPHVN